MDTVSPIEKQDVLGNTIQPECLQTLFNGQPMHNLNRGAKGVCLFCSVLRAAYQRGRKEEQDYHAECECHRMSVWFETNGKVEWCVFDGVEFVPQSVALAEYQRGREDAADAIAAEYDRRKTAGRVESYRDGLLDGLDIAESIARGGEQE